MVIRYVKTKPFLTLENNFKRGFSYREQTRSRKRRFIAHIDVRKIFQGYCYLLIAHLTTYVVKLCFPFVLQVVGQYLGYTHTFELFSDLLHFPNGDGPHANRPPCGFVGELCISYCKLTEKFR